MLPPSMSTGMCVVALWQFITFTILLGALFIYARVIGRRLGCVDVRLKRIEEALTAKLRSLDPADTRADEAEPDIFGGQEGRRDYLTIRDLRQLSSRATRSSTPNSITVPTRRDVLKTTSGPRTSSGAGRGSSVAIASEIGRALRVRVEQLSSHGTHPLAGHSVPTSLEGRDAPVTNSGLQNPPDFRPPSEDSVAKRNRDMILFFCNQRRRRRARLGY
jgi:hypothetical protein